MDITIRNNLKKIEELFLVYRQKFFDGNIIVPVITFNPNPNARKSALGWCSTKKIWINKNTNVAYYEITICPEFLDRSIYEISGTLLHEMTHLYNIQNNIKDCSRNNVYHNKYFKAEAEKRGLLISFSKQIGWSKTELNDEAKQFIDDNVDLKLVPLVRGDIHITNTGNETGDTREIKKTSIKYSCPSCKNSVRATKVVRIKCIDCDEHMEEEI